jgi:hypothetical protein
VLIGPGLTVLTRIWRACKSTVQVRANDRTAAFVALYTLKEALPLLEAIEAVRIIELPSNKSGSAFCTVKSSPLTLMPNILSKWQGYLARYTFLLLPSIDGDTREVSAHHFACRLTSFSLFSSRDQAPVREPFFSMALSPETRGERAKQLS